MNENIIQAIATELKVQLSQVENTLSLLAEGNTVPFIARYRKEATKGLDEEQIFYIQKQYEYQQKLAERKENVLKLIEEQGKLTEEIKQSVIECTKLSQVEDIYRPYAQKKKTRATTAIKNGLQPLADWMLALPTEGSLEAEAEKYLSETVTSVADAIQGAKDIIAEVVSDNAKQRWAFKDTIMQAGVLQTKLKKDAVDENKVYEMYYDRSEKISQLADHRIMAIDRAEKEKVITVSFVFDDEQLKKNALKTLLKGQTTIVEETLNEAVIDGCDRLLFPSIEREIRSELSERAQNKSIEIFSMNLEKLLLQAPLKGRIVLGFDPGFFNGCKLAVIDETGKMLTVSKIFPFSKKGEDIETSKKKLLALIQKYHVQIIAIGNGTASRESEKLVAELIHEQKLDVSYAIVSEAGASVWSAQEAARKEFPDIEVEERSAVSIGRRLLDPLAELIKIDPQSIGVGQYQHDVNQKQLTHTLDQVVETVVNHVGVELNTASPAILQHVAGISSAVAKNIVAYRQENGVFKSRKELLKVPRLGPAAFTQCAGFLRLQHGKNPLDNTSVHPESYELAERIIGELGFTLKDLQDKSQLEALQVKLPLVDADKMAAKLDAGVPTVRDILAALAKPGRDPREDLPAPLTRKHVVSLEDIKVGTVVKGTVHNVVDFGAFVDFGLKTNGLLHRSELCNSRQHPSDVLAVGDIIEAQIISVDVKRNRIGLSVKALQPEKSKNNDNNHNRNNNGQRRNNDNRNNNRNNGGRQNDNHNNGSRNNGNRRN